ncbi:MAG: hypothetical protein EXR73_00555 [Myxococcales bacterium]|nr:hypothetical protein [Myxococcales bacterium]
MRNAGKGLVLLAIVLAAAASIGFWIMSGGNDKPTLVAGGKTAAEGGARVDALAAPADVDPHTDGGLAAERAADPKATTPETATAATSAPIPTADHLIGIVVDAQGQPVAGANVSYGGSTLPAFARGRGGPGGRGGRGGRGRGRSGISFINPTNAPTEVQNVTAKTGLDGSFHLAKPARTEGIELRVDHPDYVLLVRNDLVLPASGLDVGHLKLEAGGAVTGFVYGPGGAKLSGADVILSDPPNEEPGRNFFSFNFGARGERHATTDEEGRFRLTGMPVGKAVVEASADGLVTSVSAPIEVIVQQTAGEVVLHLERGFTLKGTVKDAGGKPVAGAELTAADPSDWQRLMRSTGTPDYVTDDDGRYEISGLKAGAISITATATGFARKETPNIDPAQTSTLDITLGETLFVAGRVQLKGTSEAPSDIKVQLVPHWGDNNINMPLLDTEDLENKSTDAGLFRVEGVEPGDYRVIARGAGTTRGTSEPIKIEDGKSVENLVVEVERGALVSGRVLDPSGAPVTNAALRAAEPRPPQQDDGNAVALTSTGIRLGGGRALRMPRMNFDGRRTLGRTTTDADGRYKIEHLGVGTLEVEITHPDFAMLVATVADVTAGEQRKDVDFRLPRGGTLEGTIVGIDGAPRAGDRVNVQSKSIESVHLSAVSDANGYYRVDHVPAGEAVATREEQETGGGGAGDFVFVMAGGGGQPEEGKTVLVEEGQTTQVDFSQMEKPILEGIVTCADGPVAGATVSASPDGGGGRGFPGLFGGQRKEATTGADGRYRLTDLDPGTLRVSARHPQGLVPTTATVTVAAGESSRQDFALEGGVIEGQVVGAGTKNGIEGAVVQLEVVREEDGGSAGGALGVRMEFAISLGGRGRGRTMRFGGGDDPGTRVMTARDGSFSVPWVPAGKYRVRVTHSGHLTASSEPVALAMNARVSDVKLEMPPAARLKVHVRNKATGQPVEGTGVQLSTENEGGGFEMTDAEGVATFESLKPGTWNVSLRDIDFGRGRGGGGASDAPSTSIACEAGLTAETTIDM